MKWLGTWEGYDKTTHSTEHSLEGTKSPMRLRRTSTLIWGDEDESDYILYSISIYKHTDIVAQHRVEERSVTCN